MRSAYVQHASIQENLGLTQRPRRRFTTKGTALMAISVGISERKITQRSVFWLTLFIYALLWAIVIALSASFFGVSQKVPISPTDALTDASGALCGYLGQDCDYIVTVKPTPSPTPFPITPTESKSPTSSKPTRSPTTQQPTTIPTNAPTLAPSNHPTLAPTFSPSIASTLNPTTQPTSSPSSSPAQTMTLSPTKAPNPSPSS